MLQSVDRGPSRPPKIAFFGLFGVGNFGNDGSLEAGVAAVRDMLPGASLTCICGEPDVVNAKLHIEAISYLPGRNSSRLFQISNKITAGSLNKIRQIIWLFRIVRGNDVILVPGTGILDDFGERVLGMPFTLFVLAIVCRLHRVKLAYFAIGAGPIEHPLARFFMVTSAKLAAYRSFRDTASKDFMTSLSPVFQSDAVVPDIAFLLPDPPAGPIDHGPTIGLGVMYYRGWNNRDQQAYAAYIDRMAEIALHFLSKGARIRLIRGESGDALAARDLLARVLSVDPGAGPAITLDEAADLREVMLAFARTDVAVVTRFHNLVSALKAHRPTYAFTYGIKNQSLQDRVGLNDFHQSVDDVDVANAIERIERLQRDRDLYATSISVSMSRFQDAVKQELERLLFDTKRLPIRKELSKASA
jgi:polysaccharide pyruvyl transferase WcaK-like protein